MLLKNRTVHLASNSPRRKELILKIAEKANFVTADIDETIPQNLYLNCSDMIEVAKKAVCHLAKKKNLTALKITPFNSNDIFVAADTLVATNSAILGKPSSYYDAFNMLKSLSETTHSVVTGVSLICPKTSTIEIEKEELFFCETKVTFRKLSDSLIKDYIDTNESFDKAGSYGIQGLGNLLTEKIEGDFYNVVGLPISEIYSRIIKL